MNYSFNSFINDVRHRVAIYFQVCIQKIWILVPSTSFYSFILTCHRGIQWLRTRASRPPWPTPCPGTSHSRRRARRGPPAPSVPGPATPPRSGTHRAAINKCLIISCAVWFDNLVQYDWPVTRSFCSTHTVVAQPLSSAPQGHMAATKAGKGRCGCGVEWEALP